MTAGQYSNIAREGVATQIDDWSVYTTADKAIDGNTSGILSDTAV